MKMLVQLSDFGVTPSVFGGTSLSLEVQARQKYARGFECGMDSPAVRLGPQGPGYVPTPDPHEMRVGVVQQGAWSEASHGAEYDRGSSPWMLKC